MNLKSALLTDLYQLTMAQGYWQLGRAEQEVVFQLTFRKNPFGGNFTVACGLANAIEYLAELHFTADELDYLASVRDAAGKAQFTPEFLKYLQNLRFTCDIDAIPEGTVVFPQEPLLRLQGPLLQCQLLETPLINLINFASVVATKAAYICNAAQGDPVIEFGLRRAQGPNGGMTATRSAFIGGCESTSNVLAGKMYGIPIKGTQAHSWIMSYPDELTSFRDYVKISNNTILLVDTFDTIHGVKNAIIVGKELQQQGRELLGVRLDSGDLLSLSRQTREMLDQAGFTNTKILASGDLDAIKIAKLKAEKAPIDAWGVGTKLTTAYDQPSLDAIYKLLAIKINGHWEYKMKISDAANKTTLPGIQQVRRYYHQQLFIKDVIYDVELGISDELPKLADQCEDLGVPIFRAGKLIYQSPTLVDMQNYCLHQVRAFNQSKIAKYDVELEPKLQKVIDDFAKSEH